MNLNSKLISILSLLVLVGVFAGVTFAGESERLQSVCIEQSIFANGDYLNIRGEAVVEDTETGWINVKGWYTFGQSVELYDLNDGDIAFFIWDEPQAPFTFATGDATIEVHTGMEAETICNDPVDQGIYDGRINTHFNHMLASIYPAASGDGYDVFLFNPASGKGELNFTVSWAAIQEKLTIADQVFEWQLVASGEAGSFFAGSNGTCFIVSPNQNGEMQTFSWQCA